MERLISIQSNVGTSTCRDSSFRSTIGWLRAANRSCSLPFEILRVKDATAEFCLRRVEMGRLVEFETRSELLGIVRRNHKPGDLPVISRHMYAKRQPALGFGRRVTTAHPRLPIKEECKFQMQMKKSIHKNFKSSGVILSLPLSRLFGLALVGAVQSPKAFRSLPNVRPMLSVTRFLGFKVCSFVLEVC